MTQTRSHEGRQTSPLLLSGSLVVAIPTRDGLVFAADSRMTVSTLGYFDTDFKIVEPDRPRRTAFAITGTSSCAATPPDGVDLGEWAKTAPRTFDLSAHIKTWLEEQAETEVSESLMRGLAKMCCNEIATQAWIVSKFAGKEVCVIALGSYSPDRKASILTKFKIALSSTAVRVIDLSYEEVGTIERPTAFRYGVEDYVVQHVLPQGPELLGSFQTFLRSGDRTVGEISADEGASFAADLITATAKRMEQVPHDFPVGGPVDIVLLGEAPTAVRLRWKASPGAGRPSSENDQRSGLLPPQEQASSPAMRKPNRSAILGIREAVMNRGQRVLLWIAVSVLLLVWAFPLVETKYYYWIDLRNGDGLWSLFYTVSRREPISNAEYGQIAPAYPYADESLLQLARSGVRFSCYSGCEKRTRIAWEGALLYSLLIALISVSGLWAFRSSKEP